MAKTAFITGAARGIGAAIAAAFHDAGMNVALTDRVDTVVDTATRIDAGSNSAHGLVLDVDDETAFCSAFERVRQKFGRVDVMVNNAAMTAAGSVWNVSAADWDAVMVTNLRGVFFGCRIAGLHMRDRPGGGRIINLTSIAGQRGGTATGPHYAASKAGIIVVTKIFAQELAQFGVTVNALAPAAIEGPIMDTLPAEARGGLQRMIPVGRLGRDSDVTAAALYLASDAAGYVTGATLDINGGLLMR